MNLKVKKSYLYDYILVLVLLTQVFIVQWLRLTYDYTYIIDVVIIIRILTLNKKGRKYFANMLILASLFAVYTTIQCVRHFEFRVLRSNYHTIIPAILLMLYLYVSSEGINRIEKILKKIFLLINIYMIINIPVMIMEMNGATALSGRRLPTDIENTYLPDLISGLFGYNGTPNVAVFCCFYFVYGLWYFRHFIKKSNRIKFMIYYSIMSAFYLYIAIPSENKAFYLLLAIALIVYYLCIDTNYKKLAQKLKGRTKFLVLALSGILLFVFFYNRSADFAYRIDKIVSNFFEGLSATNDVVGGAERLGALNYYLRSSISKPLGVGVCSMFWQQELGFGFVHFGQNDLAPFLLIGGFLFVLLILLFFYVSMIKMNGSVFISIMETFFLLIIMLYTQAITNTGVFISVMLLMLIYTSEKKMNKNQMLNR